jgi:hypothetical protein
LSFASSSISIVVFTRRTFFLIKRFHLLFTNYLKMDLIFK